LQNLASKAFVILSAVGIGDAILTALEYTGDVHSKCYVNSSINCQTVIQSGHTSIFGIPFWVAGVVWFPLMLALGLYLTKGATWRLRGDILLPLLLVGDIFTIYLWYLELAVIHAVCPYCLSLYLINYAMTGLVIFDLIF
jgi:uncharacterized membrane protein